MSLRGSGRLVRAVPSGRTLNLFPSPMTPDQPSLTPAAMSSDANGAATRTGTPRRLLRFVDVELESRPNSVSCRVTLKGHSDRVFVGEGTSVVLGPGRMQAAARATVHAIRAYADVPVNLESCAKTQVGGRDLVLVVVSVSTEPAQDLAGAVVVRGDDSRAAALAVLDATNRWLETRVTDRAA